ncbi:helix-turn-helix transcriptional regulator [Planomonospora venezuelensis]|uniref:Putative DNA-binding transcriptional regulator YafY n=1 Tax=Planomonospora venezuelensis TaxID=1999 RepID=A0A841CWB0_PLAVE|nr:YafY family protein [Planomonospora venezuelensis]MBB5962682.1 putative DNA-binding transcriptional regulator YafY [Planomonospora venezuelensis]GIN01617.1 transcriptional regulator [Planomonospora venezuelensis]
MADVTGRMLALLSTLQTGRPFSGEELASRLAVSPRTVRRDIERLRGYGYPVETQPGPGGYYRLVAGRTLPPLVLDDDEAVATLLGLATLASARSGQDGALDDAATRAYGKLDQFLPARLRPRAAALRTSLETGQQLAPGVNAEVLAGLAEAIARREVVAFDYTDRQGRTSRRRVEPHRQVHLHLRWYLLGWDLGRDDWRVFRVDRVTDAVRTDARGPSRELPADTALSYLRQGLNADRRRVRLTVRAKPHEVADALKYQDARIQRVDDQETRVTVWLDSWEWLVLSLVFLDADFSIIEPPEFREACSAFARRLSAACGGASSGQGGAGSAPGAPDA